MNSFRSAISLFLLIFFFIPQLSSLNAFISGELLSTLSEISVSDVPAPLSAETYPDYEQDRKPAFQIYNSDGIRILDGVRFEHYPEAGLYAWREMKLEDAELDEVYWGYRSGGVGHNFILFTFKSGAESSGKAVKGLVIEALPWKKKEQGYSPFGGGTSGAYPLVWNVVEWNSFLETSIKIDDLRIDIYPMKLSREEKLRMLDEGISEATRDHTGEKYHTFTNSCSSNALKVFTAATDHSLFLINKLPYIVVKHMKLRGFLGKRIRYKSSNWPN